MRGRLACYVLSTIALAWAGTAVAGGAALAPIPPPMSAPTAVQRASHFQERAEVRLTRATAAVTRARQEQAVAHAKVVGEGAQDAEGRGARPASALVTWDATDPAVHQEWAAERAARQAVMAEGNARQRVPIAKSLAQIATTRAELGNTTDPERRAALVSQLEDASAHAAQRIRARGEQRIAAGKSALKATKREIVVDPSHWDDYPKEIRDDAKRRVADAPRRFNRAERLIDNGRRAIRYADALETAAARAAR